MIFEVDDFSSPSVASPPSSSCRLDDLPGELLVEILKASKLPKLLARFPSLAVLNLNFLFDCSEDSLASIGRLCPRLLELHVPETCKAADGAGLVALARGCPNLSILSLPAFKGPDHSLMALGSHLPRLLKLRLRSVPHLTDAVVAHIAQSCRRLEELDLSFTDITDAALAAVGAGLQALEHLDVKHCKRVTGAGVAQVAAGCPQLRLLHLGVVDVSDDGLAALGRHSRRLEELYLDYGAGETHQLSREAFSSLAAGCRKLRVLSLRGSRQVDSGAVSGLARGCPSLEVLDMHACDAVADEGLAPVIAGCKKLRELVLTGTAVGAAGVHTFRGGLPHLELLRLNGELVTDAVLHSVAANCPALTEIHLSNCHVSDEGIQRLLAGCARLRALSVKACADVKATAFDGVTCAALETVALPSCGVSDEGLLALVRACPALTSLSLPACLKLTAAGLAAALAEARAVKEASVAGCKQLMRDDIVRLTRCCRPALRSIRVSRPHCPDDEYTLKRLHVGWQLPSWARSSSSSTSPRLSAGLGGSRGLYGSRSAGGTPHSFPGCSDALQRPLVRGRAERRALGRVMSPGRWGGDGSCVSLVLGGGCKAAVGESARVSVASLSLACAFDNVDVPQAPQPKGHVVLALCEHAACPAQM
ncbi:unnamed protein product [Closterium sp. NIES-64]|nr:unnamed protein product [Closterium sp. NIES-64]